jgi:beta-lactamase class A
MVAVGVGMAVDRGLTPWPAELEPMITVSDNDATTACVALLHRLDMMDPLNRRFAELDLATLQINNTRPDGGWRNGDGAGVGQIHMTAWDTVRLLWLLDAAAPPPPWLAPGTALLRDESRAHLHEVLRRQQLDEILSSGALRGQEGWVAGLPDAPVFAHKTGTTDNYGADGGIVQDGATHYIVTVLTSLGQRYAPTTFCATTWRLPALGGAVHRLMLGLR